MDQWEFLARHHRRVVDQFIESALDDLGLGGVERNVVGVALRREVETGLVPGLTAIQAVFHAADAATLGKSLPEWLDRVSSALPAESEFLAEMGRCLDPVGYDLLETNLGLQGSESEARRVFEAHLWEMAPSVPKVGAPLT